ncbi:MAG: LacI family DNA-binding transcriptional regulator [Phycisphaerales bacterium]
MAVRQQAIAQELNLSVSTVSRALRNDRAIPATTRARVIRTANDLGYRGKPVSRVSVSDQQQTFRGASIIVFAPVISGFNWSTACTHEAGHFMLTGISAGTATRGVFMRFHSVRDTDLDAWLNGDPAAVLPFEGEAPDGAVLLYSHPFAFVQKLHERMPCVSIVNKYPGLMVDCVGEDVDAGIDTMVRHLREQGHTRIGFVNGGYQGEWTVDRYAGYFTAMIRGGLPVDPSRVLGVSSDGLNEEQRIKRLIDLTRKGVTAWVCANDLTGYGVCRALAGAGLRVPEDVSVTGFDGVEPIDAAPALTTVSAPLVELGEEAVDRLLFRIDNPTDSVRHIQLSCRMKAGQTTARARDKQKLS